MKDRYVTKVTAEEIEEQIRRCDENIKIFSSQIAKQEELRADLLKMLAELRRQTK